MTLAIMQPYFYPYLGYWQLIAAADKFILLDDVSYINRGWINRNRLPGGRFTIPLKGASQNRLIKDIEITGDLKWFFEMLHRLYGSAPYYHQAMGVINITGNLIGSACYFGITQVCKYLGITTDIVPSSTVYGVADLRSQYKIMNICLQEGATRYINPIMGAHLYSDRKFYDSGIELRFLKCKNPHRFSIIDLLMNHSPEEIKTWLKEDYELLEHDSPALREMLPEAWR